MKSPKVVHAFFIVVVASLHLILVDGDSCINCYYKSDVGQRYAYQVRTCAGTGCTDENRGNKTALTYPASSQVTSCKDNKCATETCTLPGGTCVKDGDCCSSKVIPKFYPKGKYTNIVADYIQLTETANCVLESCQLNVYKNGSKTLASQTCYIQDPTVANYYLVSAIKTCAFCPKFNGKRDDKSLGLRTGILTKDGVVLSNVKGKCTYCSVLGGKCEQTSDCCVGYSSFAEKVETTGTFYDAYKVNVDKVKCSEGKCVIDACFKHKEECIYGSSKKCCLESDVCAPRVYGGTCVDKSTVVPVDCPKKAGLVGCRGYTSGNAYCNCTFPTPEKCLDNGQCSSCSMLGESCNIKEDCCSVSHACVDKKCSKCAASNTSCENLRCCTGTCKEYSSKGGYDKRCS